MKKLKSNFTTPEQSKQLLELGLPADSADCIRTLYNRQNDDKQIEVLIEPFSVTVNGNFDSADIKIFPCWSVGRLIEIAWICHNTYGFFMTMCTAIGRIFKAEQSITEIMIDCLFDSTIDFSKLEE